MISVAFDFLIVVFVFSLLIIVHELGHFFAARLAGVKVTDFSIGFGPALWKRKINETNFLISVFPLGGYIKMAGDSRVESRGYKDEFFSKSPGVRSGIVLAGPLFNYLLAFFVLAAVALIGFHDYETVIGAVGRDSPAEKAGIEPEDRLIAVDGRKVVSWSQFESRVYRAREPLNIILEREGREIEFEVGLEKKKVLDDFGREIEVPCIGVYPYGPVVGRLVEGYPAEKAGLKKGDRILKIDGEEIKKWEDISASIKNSEESVLLKVEREGEVFSLKVPVKRKARIEAEAGEEKISVIGIQPLIKEKIVKESFPFFLAEGFKVLIDTTFLSLRGIWYMIVDPEISFQDSVAGPIYISYMISKTAQLGAAALLQLVALLSIFLFIVNLFPIPIFDGGHILFFGIEKIRGKPLSQKAEDTANRIGLFLIILLMFFVFYNDIVRRGPQIWEDIRGSFQRGESLYTDG